MNAPDRWTYTDLAIAPPRDNEFDQLSLYHATSGANRRSRARRSATAFAISRGLRPLRCPRRRRDNAKAMIEAAQVRAARALIGWSQAELANASGLSLSIVERFESGASENIPSETADKIARGARISRDRFLSPRTAAAPGSGSARAANRNTSAGKTSTRLTTTETARGGARPDQRSRFEEGERRDEPSRPRGVLQEIRR